MAAGEESSRWEHQSGAGHIIAPAIPEHVLVRRIGKGSYGEIWLARCDLGLHRAVKIIRRSSLQDHPGAYEREFAGIAKYEPFSRQHEGLVQILQFGRGGNGASEFFYYVMELADNMNRHSTDKPNSAKDQGAAAFAEGYVPCTLAHDLRTRAPLPLDAVLDLGERLGSALAFLHSQRLVHRDIKPSNIVFVSGMPKLADVGCVADLENSLSAAGTVGYMPAEGPSTISADLYSVGKVLYEAATGKDRQEFPDLPTQVIAENSAGFLELNEIWLKACANRPTERYDSAAQFLADLNQLRQGKSLRKSRLHRKQVVLSLAALGLVVGAAALAGLTWTVKPAGPKPQPQLIFGDEFDGPCLDTNRWTWATKESPGLGNSGHRQFSIAQTNGELRIAAQAQHEHGYSTFGAAWVETSMDFRSRGDCRLEVQLTGTNNFGLLGLCATDGAIPSSADSQIADMNTVRLLTCDGQTWVNDRVAIEFLPGQQAAVLYPDSKIREQFEIIDLAHLEKWRLRFYTEANSSAVCNNGMATLNLRSVSAVTQPGPHTIIGHVANELTGLPIADAIVKDQSGARVAKSLANGAFKLTPEAWPVRLRVEHPAFLVSDEKVISSESRKSGATTIELRKKSRTFGDVVDVVSYKNLDFRNIGFVDGKLCALAAQGVGGSAECLLFPVDFATRRIWPETMRFQTGEHPFGCFVQCAERLIATSAWPGRIHELTAANHAVVFEPKHALDGDTMHWPWTAAFDGTNLWILERDLSKNRLGLNQLDLQSRASLRHLRSADTDLAGLAWDGDSHKFWISNFKGRVYAVDRAEAIRGGTLESGIERGFTGHYTALAFGHGHLWGLDTQRRQICKIKIKD
jgi:serine/threonine protein kinase